MAELLAPAGNMASFLAALRAGADAVYLGMKSFGARASAGNFSLEELREVRRLSALHGVKIYITMNTLIKERELPAAMELLKSLADIAPDAIIVQDIGLAHRIRQALPDMPLHASTQMGIHSVSGARFLQSVGFTRAVLARECSLDIIRAVTAIGIEVEVFVHGALCVSMSGQCLLSSFYGGRSGNRGRCAQPCRQKLRFGGGEKAAWLSTRDIMLYDQLPALLAAGVHSFKIEGRLKSPSYVAHLCKQYRKGMEACRQNAFEKLSKAEYIEMLQSFNRGDFSQGYAGGSEDAGIINPERSNNQGLRIGFVERVAKSLLYLRLERDLKNGDMLRVTEGQQESDFELIYSGQDKRKGELASAYYRGNAGIRAGLPVYRLISERQAEAERCLPPRYKSINISLRLCQGQPAQVQISDGSLHTLYHGEPCAAAENAPLQPERIVEVFRKTAEHGLVAADVQVETDGVFLPISKLNALRRAALEDFAEKSIARNLQSHRWQGCAEQEPAFAGIQQRIVISSQIDLQTHLKADEIFVYYPFDTRRERLEQHLSQLHGKAYVLLPTTLSDESAEYILELCRQHRLTGVVLDNISQLGLRLQGLRVAFGAHIPLMNSAAVAALLPYAPDFILAFPELSTQEMADTESRFHYLCYGRERMMILNHCPARTALGLQRGKEHCRMCHEGDPRSLLGKEFIDRKEYAFPLLPLFTDGSCVVEMYNAAPTNLSGLAQMPKPGYIHFTTEPLAEQIILLRRLRQGKTLPDGTLGHYQSGVI